jgi:NAD(P)H dehydrogenase (quinone)
MVCLFALFAHQCRDPRTAAEIIADADRGLARGDLHIDSGHLRRLIGRPTTSLHDAVGAALR